MSTMCSSSLVALDAACLNLNSGRCQSALSAGVSLMLHATGWVAVDALSALSVDGCCKTFDARAGTLPQQLLEL